MAEENKVEEKVEEPIKYEELEDNDLLNRYYKKAIRELKKCDNDFAKFYLDVCNSGTNRFYQKNITETKYIDDTWILTLEGLVPSIDRIIRNPKKTIRYEEDVVLVEKAKKIDAASVRHLASHTGLIRDVNRDTGQVTPTKILTRFAEEEIATYENRFIMTLINRLYLFVKARYDIIKDNVESSQHDHLVYTSNFKIKDEEVNFVFDVDVKRDLDNPNINKHNIDLLQRASQLMVHVTGFKGSQFMRDMAKAKPVQPPIMKTNVILKNAEFRNAYTLWLFLDRYNSLAYDVQVRERPVRLSREFKKDIDHISTLAYSALIQNKKRRQEDYRVIEQIEPIIKKSTKIAKINPKDVVKNPDAIEIQDNSVNEYYTLINKKIFNQKIYDAMDRKTSYLQAAKKIARESIDITNAMFDSYFNFEEETNYFERFIQTDDPKEVFEEAKEKAKIAKVIREAKDADYKRSIRMEKALYQQMLRATADRLRALNFQKKQEAYEGYIKQINKETKQLQATKERVKKQINLLNGKLEDIDKNKEARDVEFEKLKQENDQLIASIKADNRKRTNDEVRKMLQKHQEELNKMKAQMDQELEAAKEKRRLQLEKEKARLKEKADKAREKEKEKAKKEKEALKAKLDKEKAKLKSDHQKNLEKVKNASKISEKKNDTNEVKEELNEE